MNCMLYYNLIYLTFQKCMLCNGFNQLYHNLVHLYIMYCNYIIVNLMPN